jgi:hypothetical protein
MTGSYKQRMQAKQVYSDIIGSHLMKRGRAADDFNPHPDHPTRTSYEVLMCQDVLQTLHSRGFDGAQLKDVFRKESSAAGHSDYQHKFALYCAFLEEECAESKGPNAQST